MKHKKNKFVIKLAAALGLAGLLVGIIGAAYTTPAIHQTDIISALPDELVLSDLPYVQEITDELAEMNKQDDAAAILESIDVPDPVTLQTISINPDENGSAFKLPDTLTEDMKSSADKTASIAVVKDTATHMLGEAAPEITTQLQETVRNSIACIDQSVSDLGCAVSELESVTDEDQCVCILIASANMDAAKESLIKIAGWYQALHDAIPAAYETASASYLNEIESNSSRLDWMYTSLQSEDYFFIFIILSAISIVFLAGLLIYVTKQSGKKEV